MAILAGSNNTAAFTSDFSINTLSGERWAGEEMVASQSGTATELFVYVGTANDPNAKLTLRDSTGAELFTSAATAVPAGPGAWLSVALPNIAITSGQTYYGMVSTDGGVNGRVGMMTDDTFGNYISDDGSYSAPPASMTITEDGGNVHTLWYIDGTVGGGANPPAITDVDEDNTVTSTQTNVEIDGADFDTATVEIRQGAETIAQTVDSQTATAIQFDVVFDAGAGPHLKYGSATLAVINGDDQEDTIAITIAAPTGVDFVDVGTPNATAENRITAVSDIASGDQIEISNVIGGTIADVTVNDDATFECDEAVESFDVRVWDASDATWGDIATQTVGDPGADETPDAFAFTDVTGAQTSTVQTSNTITVTGLGDGVSVAVTVSGGTYSKNGGAFTASAGTAVNGDTFAVRHTSSSSYETAVDTTLTISGVSDTYTSTTQAEPAPSEGGGLVVPILRRRRRR